MRPAHRLATIALGALAAAAGALALAALLGDSSGIVRFEWFEYRGEDGAGDVPPDPAHYRNPIVAGFFPDPSIVRRGDDYYMVHSSFGYLPGIPVLHSRNLADWRIAAHVFERPEQLSLAGLQVSRGIFAPTIRHHDGRFWVVGTAVDAGGNFVVTADEATGPWSAPHWLPEVDGIDPDLFFDTDGRGYLAHNGPPPGEPLYDGHRAIWLWEFDAATLRVRPGSQRLLVNGGTELARRPIWIEGPHLYRVGDWYYLLCAEGGTAEDHSAVVFRSRSVTGPFEPWEGNPILTQRDMPEDRAGPVTSAGHADFVQASDGGWWAVFLATRPYEGRHYNTGRETFLLPVRWQEGWPRILEPGRAIPAVSARPPGLPPAVLAGAQRLSGDFDWRDEFDGDRPGLRWLRLRSLEDDWLEWREGRAELQAQAAGLASRGLPAYLGTRQQHLRFRASTALLLPEDAQVSAGLAAFQNETHHYYLGVRRQGRGYRLFLEQATGGPPTVVAETSLQAAPGASLTLAIDGDRGRIGFAYALAGTGETWLARELDGRLLSTAVAGGFVGTTLGVHARREPL